MPVSVEQVAVELARPIPTSPVSDQWESWIGRAYRLVEAKVGSAAYALLDPDLVDDVVLAAVVEHVRGWRDSTASRYTVAIDDGSVSKTFESSSGPLTIPDYLWDLLEVPVPGQSFTIEP